jgi:hypothetical protein
MTHKTTQPNRPIPPTTELFSKPQLVQRHPHLLTPSRVDWALRNRDSNGLEGAVYESRGGELLVHEPGFLAWFLGLDGRAKPRASRSSSRRARPERHA